MHNQGTFVWSRRVILATPRTATSKSIDTFDLSIPDVLKLEKENFDDYWEFSSALINHFWDFRKGFPMRTRIPYLGGIRNITSLAVVDAIEILAMERVFEREELVINFERTLFGCHPDIMIVRGRDNVGLIAIEVKQPTKKELRSYTSVVGHAFDHAMAMKAFNVATDGWCW